MHVLDLFTKLSNLVNTCLKHFFDSANMLSDALMSLLSSLSLDLYLIFICGETLAEGFDCLALVLKLLLN